MSARTGTIITRAESSAWPWRRIRPRSSYMVHFDKLEDWLRWQENSHHLAIDLGLERVEKVYHALNPPAQKPITVTVGGTNGKGSCVAYLETIYRTAGYRVGTYTSPHILTYNERIKIDGKPVSDKLICRAFERIEQVRSGVSLSYFEFGTLAALIIFLDADLDIQILEVGLGGRLDAVNIVNPDAAIISSIAIDHVAWLGDTRGAIGFEKAGIFRAGTPAIVGDPDPPDTLRQVAEERLARFYAIGQDFDYIKTDKTWQWHSQNNQIEQLPQPALKGEHQFRNASSVIMAVNLLQDKLPVNEDSIRRSLMDVDLPGRFQLINGDVQVLLDVGHNPEAVGTLVEYLTQNFPKRRIHAIFSMMRDKDIAEVIKIMNPIVHDWFFSPLTNVRAASEELMQDIFSAQGITNVTFGFTGFKDAFAAAKKHTARGDLLLIFGSFFLVSEYLTEFNLVGEYNGS